MKKRILVYPDKRLREKGQTVDVVDNKILSIVDDLTEVLKEDAGGVGLAALQIGYAKSILAIKKDNKIRLIFNPKLIKVYGKKQFPLMKLKDEREEDFLEGCLSFPDIYGTIKRFFSFDLEWEELNRKKNILEKKAGKWEGYEAIVIQHEMDHLNGILLIDRIMDSNGKIYKFVGKKMIDWSVEKVLKLV
jgi:peptide deformylase